MERASIVAEDIGSVGQSQNTDDEKHRAKLFTVSCARDTSDAILLLDMLGLIDPYFPIKDLEKSKRAEERARNRRRRAK